MRLRLGDGAWLLLPCVALVIGEGCFEDAVLSDTAVGGSTSAIGGGGASSGTAGSTSGTGGAPPPPCTIADDCPGIDVTCRIRTCITDVCGVSDTPAGTPCNEDGGKLCSGAGQCVECVEMTDCTGGLACVNNVCGALVEQGDPCMGDAECVTGNCADGVCCDLACDAPCMACTAAKTCGVDGACKLVTAGTDPDTECNGNNVCFGGSCQTGKIAFVTSTTSDGNIGGVAGADTMCATAATNGCLPGTYMAWIGTTADSPNSRFTQANVPYRRVDGTAIATNYADLTDNAISSPLNLDELGQAPPIVPVGCPSGMTMVFSGIGADGAVTGPAAERCNDWTSNAPAGSNIGPTWGYTHLSNNLWSAGCFSTDGACEVAAPFYCFEQ
jgi:hypothetical protein